MGRSATGVAVEANAGAENPTDARFRNGAHVIMLDRALRLD